MASCLHRFRSQFQGSVQLPVMQKQPVLAGRKWSLCAGLLWKEGRLCSRDNPQCCNLSMAAAQRTSATLKCSIHMGSRIHSSQCEGHGFSSHLMAAGVRRMTAKKHAGFSVRHVQRGWPFQTLNSGKVHSRAGKQNGLVAPLLCTKGLLLGSDLLFHCTPSDSPKADF